MPEGTHPPMLRSLHIDADLTSLLSRHALSEYSLACEAAHIAAEQYGVAEHPHPDGLGLLRISRANVICSEDTLKIVGDAVHTHTIANVSLDDCDRALIGKLAGTALQRLTEDLEATEEEIIAAADRIMRLRALLDELE